MIFHHATTDTNTIMLRMTTIISGVWRYPDVTLVCPWYRDVTCHCQP